jgi:hypothetical protein
MAGTTRLELATSAVTVSRLQVLSTTWKSTDGTASHWKYVIDNVNVYRDVYRGWLPNDPMTASSTGTHPVRFGWLRGTATYSRFRVFHSVSRLSPPPHDRLSKCSGDCCLKDSSPASSIPGPGSRHAYHGVWFLTSRGPATIRIV